MYTSILHNVGFQCEQTTNSHPTFIFLNTYLSWIKSSIGHYTEMVAPNEIDISHGKKENHGKMLNWSSEQITYLQWNCSTYMFNSVSSYIKENICNIKISSTQNSAWHTMHLNEYLLTGSNYSPVQNQYGNLFRGQSYCIVTDQCDFFKY